MLIKSCMEQGEKNYEKGNFLEANKYFTRVMEISEEKSQEYKTAKSKVSNV